MTFTTRHLCTQPSLQPSQFVLTTSHPGAHALIRAFIYSSLLVNPIDYLQLVLPFDSNRLGILTAQLQQAASVGN